MPQISPLHTIPFNSHSLRSVVTGAVLLGLSLATCVLAAPAIAYDVPPPTGYVNDFADILPPTSEESLELQLKTTAERSGAEVRLVTLTSLGGEDPTAVAHQFFEAWQIGQKDQPKGVMLLVSVNDKALQIVDSTGEQPVLPTAVKTQVIDQKITPSFNETNYQGGIQAGVNGILLYLDNPESLTAIGPDGVSSAPEFNAAFRTFLILFGWYSLVLVGIIGLTYAVIELTAQTPVRLGGLTAATLGFILGQFHGVGILIAALFGVAAVGAQWYLRDRRKV